MHKLLYKKPKANPQIELTEKEIEQEEYLIKFNIYVSTRDTSVFSRPLHMVLQEYGNLVAIEKLEKENCYDPKTKLHKSVMFLDYQKLIFRLESLFKSSPSEGTQLIQDALILYKKYRNHFIETLISNYDWLAKHNQNPNNYQLTISLYSLLPKRQKDEKLNKLITQFPTFFPLHVLKRFKSEITKFNDYSEISPLLKVYLAGQYDKYAFYLALGYSEKITYTNTYKFGNNPTDGLYSVISTCKGNYISEFEGKALKEVVNILTPGIRTLYYSE